MRTQPASSQPGTRRSSEVSKAFSSSGVRTFLRMVIRPSQRRARFSRGCPRLAWVEPARGFYGRVQRVAWGTQAIPTFEQAAPPSAWRAQTRHPSVHSWQLAGMPPCPAGGCGRSERSAAAARLTLNRSKAIERSCLGPMALEPIFPRFPLVLPAGEPALAKLQIEPLLDPGPIRGGERRPAADEVKVAVPPVRHVCHVAAEYGGRLFGRHAKADELARRARAAERKPPDAKCRDDPPPHPIIIPSCEHAGSLDGGANPAHNRQDGCATRRERKARRRRQGRPLSCN